MILNPKGCICIETQAMREGIDIDVKLNLKEEKIRIEFKKLK